MATISTYYLNGPDLSSATAIFTDSALTTCAPNGYYRQGAVVRQLVGCVLLPPQTCPTCADNCGTTVEAVTTEGVYNIPIYTGEGPADVGAIVIRFDPLTAPDGIQATYDGVVYNTLSSPNYGLLSGATGLATYIGDSGADCGLVIDSPYVLDVYSWYGSSFSPQFATENVSVVSGQLDLTASTPGTCVMVVPKPIATPAVIDLKVISPCPIADFVMSIDCPVLLESFESTVVWETFASACVALQNQTYHYVHVNGAAGVLGLYDWVFSDYYGENVLPDGYYGSTAVPSPNTWFRVQDGIIVEFGGC